MYHSMEEIGCIGSFDFMYNVTVEAPVRVQSQLHGECSIGAFTYILQGGELWNVKIGRFCSIAPGVVVGPGNHPTDFLSTHPFANDYGDIVNGFSRNYPEYKNWIGAKNSRHQKNEPTVIGSDVWIGQNAIILPGVKVGDGAIIGAGAVVSKDVPPYSIVGGIPASIIKMRFDAKTVARLLELQFWNWGIHAVTAEVDYSNVDQSINIIRSGINNGTVKPFTPQRFKINDGTAIHLS